jgi:glycosyltransferase involved in cell wall biosynthesis
MKIGLVIYGSLDTMSGGYLYDRQLVAHLRAQGDTVEIISLPWRNYLSHLTDNFHFRLPAGFDALIQDELNHPSLLAANSGPHPCPVVGLVHNLRSAEPRPGWQNGVYRSVERRYLDSVDGFIFNSETTRDAVQALTGGAQPCVVATPGGDRLGSLKPDSVRARAAESGPLRLLFLANVTPLKGLHVLLEAMRHLGSDLRLEVVGSLAVDRRYVRRMQQYVMVHGLSPVVYFHGLLDGEALGDELERSQVLVIPSSYEGFGISYLEGMAFGLPAIGTTAGAIPQLITDGANGYLIAPGDSEALAGRLAGLVSDRELLARLSLQALKRYQSRPTWSQTGQKIRDFLLEVVS